MISNVFHHRPPEKAGSKVTDLTGQPGMMGWMPFIHHGIIAENVARRWVLRPANLVARIEELAPDIERAGYLMLDLEPPLGDPRATDLYIEASEITNEVLSDLDLEETIMGWYRILDHKEIQRFTQVEVLPFVSGVFVIVKSPKPERTSPYLRDIIREAPHHAHIVYLDGYNHRKNQQYTKERVIDTVRMAHGGLVNPQFVFRGTGEFAAQGMKWAAEFLGEVADG